MLYSTEDSGWGNVNPHGCTIVQGRFGRDNSAGSVAGIGLDCEDQRGARLAGGDDSNRRWQLGRNRGII